MTLSKVPFRQRALHLWVLCAFAFAQPLFGVIANNPPFFVLHRARGLDVLALAAGALVIPALLVLAISFLAQRVARAGRLSGATSSWWPGSPRWWQCR